MTWHITDFPIGVGAFNPRALPNLLAWYDASDSSTCLNNTSPITPATNGQTVTQWTDKSGNGNHLTQGTGISQPVVATNALNGKQVLNFDGSNDSCVTGFSFALAATKTLTAFVVAKSDLSTAATFLALHRSGQPDYSSCFSSLVVSSELWLQTGLGDGGLSASSYRVMKYAPTITSYFIQSTRISTSALSQRTNGVNASLTLQSGTMLQSSWMSSGSGNYRLICGAREGSTDNTPDTFHDGQFAEVILYNAVLSDANTQRVERYLGSKWGIVV